LRRIVVLLAVSLGCLFGCGGLPLSPLTNERRQVHLEHDPSKTLTVATELLFYDASRPRYGIRFPAGIYALEAQDNEYWYLRGSLPLEFKEYKKGGTVDARSIPGGIMIGKYSFRAVPAAGYIDGEGGIKVLIWKLGSDFMTREGKDWKKSF